VSFVTFPAERVKWTAGERARYESTPGRVVRAFCRDCGTPLTWEGQHEGSDWVEFHISTLDDPDAFPPTEHVCHGERIAWFEVADELPRHASMPD